MAAMQDLCDELEQSIDSSNADHARNRVMEAPERLHPLTTVTFLLCVLIELIV